VCGIAGIAGPAAKTHRAALDRMVASLRHRGPDGQGVHVFDRCALGHTRLEVVDPAGSAQPLLARDGLTAVVFNGEVYGYRDLRAGALSGYPFRTAGDTEVLLALYERHGDAMVEHLPGMFAFAIWDERRQRLFCARDRFGEKPFFYTTTPDGTFLFGSELKAILAADLIDPEIDRTSVAHYLKYLYVHPHRTICRDVQVLPPAHRLVWEDGRIAVSRYWQLPSAEPRLGLDEAAEQFAALLSRAVARQLVADVPVGAFLSGGLDSSTIVALASRQGPRCRTFSFGFGPAIDELPYARGIAQRYGTDHTELHDSSANLGDLIVRMAEVYDEPLADSANIPTYLLCGLARRDVTVALTGEGADELLGGYEFWYRSLFDMDAAARRGRLAHVAARLAGAVCRRTALATPAWIAEENRGAVLRRQFASPGAVHATRTACFTSREVAALVPDLIDAPPDRGAGARSLDEVLRADLAGYLPGDILVKTDRAAMAHGLELRAPFLDVDVASFCASLPVALKIDRDRDKVLLRRVFEDAWTPEVRNRAKQGFGAPVHEWLRRPAVRALLHDLLGNPRSHVYDVIERAAARPLLTAGDGRTWSLLVLAAWMEHSALATRQTGATAELGSAAGS
jgi:asparagine synthase (glutamine-hydrolysing)